MSLRRALCNPPIVSYMYRRPPNLKHSLVWAVFKEWQLSQGVIPDANKHIIRHATMLKWWINLIVRWRKNISSKSHCSHPDCLSFNYLYYSYTGSCCAFHTIDFNQWINWSNLHFSSQYYQMHLAAIKWFNQLTSVKTDQTLNSEYIYTQLHNIQ